MTEIEWEDVTFEDLRIGDMVEYITRGSNREFKYWGKVLEKSSVYIFRVEGDWSLLASSWDQIKDGKGHIRRKVVEFELPHKIGAVVKYTGRDGETTFVRVRLGPHGDSWVQTSTGDYYASWEIDLLHSKHRVEVISTGE